MAKKAGNNLILSRNTMFGLLFVVIIGSLTVGYAIAGSGGQSHPAGEIMIGSKSLSDIIKVDSNGIVEIEVDKITTRDFIKTDKITTNYAWIPLGLDASNVNIKTGIIQPQVGYTAKWPDGDYCILMTSDSTGCPQGFYDVITFETRDKTWHGFLNLYSPTNAPRPPSEVKGVYASYDSRRFLSPHFCCK